jgi:hypothetical protein
MIRLKKYKLKPEEPQQQNVRDKQFVNCVCNMLVCLALFLIGVTILVLLVLTHPALQNLRQSPTSLLLAPPSIPNLEQLTGDSVILPFGYAYYEGGVSNGKLHGSGILKTPGYTYEGDFAENQLHGKGDIVFEQEMLKIKTINNELFVLRYEGEFKHNMLDGTGVVQFVNGDIYAGVFKENKFVHGTFLYQDRTFLH